MVANRPCPQARVQVLRSLHSSATHWHHGLQAPAARGQSYPSCFPRVTAEALHTRLLAGFLGAARTPDLTAGPLQPVAILDRRMVKKGNNPVVQVRVQWSSLSTESATWEDYNVLGHRYPTAPCWTDDAAAHEEATVTLDTSVSMNT